jgi:hypothetical protein
MKIINGNLINKEQNTYQKGMNFNPYPLFIDDQGYYPIVEWNEKEGHPDFFVNTALTGGSGKGAHDSINKLILQSTLSNMTRGIDDFKFGQDVERIDYPEIFGGGSYGRHHGNIQTNILESLIKSKLSDRNFEDLLNINISGRLGKDKNLDYNLSGSKGNIGLNLSKLF